MKQPIHDDHLEQLMKAAVTESIKNSPPPPLSSDEAWEKFKRKQHENHIKSNKTSMFKNKFIYAASLLLAFGSMMAFSAQNGSAFGRLSDIFQMTQGNVVQLFGKVGDEPKKDKNAPTSDQFSIVEGSEIIAKQVSLEEANQETAFTITIPKQIPKEFTLKNVTVSKTVGEKSKDIYLHYKSEKRAFTMNQKLTGEQFGFGMTVDRDDTKVEQITIQGQRGSLLQFKNGTLKLIWVSQRYYYSIQGKLTKDEAIRIAESM